MRKEIYAKVFGEVQGVFFRQFAQERAKALDIVGYAKNMIDGTVDLVAQGEEEKLKEFLSAISAGPETAQVDSLELEWGKPSTDFVGFTIE